MYCNNEDTEMATDVCRTSQSQTYTIQIIKQFIKNKIIVLQNSGKKFLNCFKRKSRIYVQKKINDESTQAFIGV